MATMYYLFWGFLFIALCSDNGDGRSVLSSLKPRGALVSFGDCYAIYSLINKEANKSRLGQYNAKYFLTALNISEPLHFAPLHRYVFNDLQKIFLTLYHPRSFFKASASSSVQSGLMSPIYVTSLCPDASGTVMEGSKNFIGKLTSYAVRPIRLHFVSLKVTRGVREQIINIASNELGTTEATGSNDGKRVEEYLRYTNLGKGYEWCAAFVSWCYGQAGLSEPRNPWSPALFPKSRQIAKDKARAADVFGIYGNTAKRINHVGIVKEISNGYLISIEGNSNDRVESRRRHLRTVYAVADWVNKVSE